MYYAIICYVIIFYYLKARLIMKKMLNIAQNPHSINTKIIEEYPELGIFFLIILVCIRVFTL